MKHGFIQTEPHPTAISTLKFPFCGFTLMISPELSRAFVPGLVAVLR